MELDSVRQDRSSTCASRWSTSWSCSPSLARRVWMKVSTASSSCASPGADSPLPRLLLILPCAVLPLYSPVLLLLICHQVTEMRHSAPPGSSPALLQFQHLPLGSPVVLLLICLQVTEMEHAARPVSSPVLLLLVRLQVTEWTLAAASQLWQTNHLLGSSSNWRLPPSRC